VKRSLPQTLIGTSLLKKHSRESVLLSGKMQSDENRAAPPCGVETLLEVQRSQIRHPGENRDPVPLTLFKSLGPGFRRDDESLGTSGKPDTCSPDNSALCAGALSSQA
jgi:hypothetical protein